MIKIIKYIFKITILLCLIIGGCLFYAFQIEPYRLTINEFEINQTSSNQLKIVQFSDTHIKEDFTYQNLDNIVNHINQQDPDIVIFTGDLYDNYVKYNDNINIINQLQKIKAKYAKIAIWGNRDYGGGASREYENIIENSGWTILKNQNYYISTDNDKQILITGLDDSIFSNAKMPDVHHTNYDYQILLSHEPDTTDLFSEYRYDLILSGHSHGGQIDIPLLPAISQKAASSTSYASKYTGGMYKLNDKTNLYVNTGIGTTHISARLGVVPEIAVFTIYL